MAKYKRVTRTKKQIEYVEKFKDPRWQKLRLKILERDNWSCQICFNTESTLHIHHRYYLPNREPWDYPDKALAALCETCHDSEKETLKEVSELLIINMRSKFFADDLLEIAYGVNTSIFSAPPELIASAISWVLTDVDIQEELIDKMFGHFKKIGAKGLGKAYRKKLDAFRAKGVAGCSK